MNDDRNIIVDKQWQLFKKEIVSDELADDDNAVNYLKMVFYAGSYGMFKALKVSIEHFNKDSVKLILETLENQFKDYENDK